MALPTALGPRCVGLRVVIRRLLPGVLGPTGGPAMTDVLGVMEAWDSTTTSIRTESGGLLVIDHVLIVSGKPVPPRPSLHSRISPADAERRALVSWPALESIPLGQWLLRAAGGFTARANSVLVCGDPGLELDAALDFVRRFYTDRGLPGWAQVAVGSPEETALLERGWDTARPGEADSVLLLGGTAKLTRHSRIVEQSLAPANVVLSGHLSEGWLEDDARAAAQPDTARSVLEGSDSVRFATVRHDTGMVLAKGRVAWSAAADSWAGITDLWVSPAVRRRGLATTVLAALVAEAAEAGITTIFLQTREDNAGALALYERLGFQVHHRYRYLAAPPL